MRAEENPASRASSCFVSERLLSLEGDGAVTSANSPAVRDSADMVILGIGARADTSLARHV